MIRRQPVLLRVRVLGLLLSIMVGIGVLISIWIPVPIKREHSDEKRLIATREIVRSIGVAGQTPAWSEAGFSETLRACGQSEQKHRQLFQKMNQALGALKDRRFVANDYVFHGEAWFSRMHDAAARCDFNLRVLEWLADEDELAKLDWKDRAYSAGLERRFEAGEQVRAPDWLFSIRNPWRALPGCVLLESGRATERKLYYVEGREYGIPEVCRAAATAIAGYGATNVEAIGSSDLQLPDSLDVLISALNVYREPDNPVYEQIIGDRGKATMGPIEKEVGLHITLTIDPRLQAIANRVARCYASSDASCQSQGVDNPGAGLYENAKVRMVAIAMVDIQSGEVAAAGSAHSRCFERQHDRLSLPKGCADLGLEPSIDPERRLNHAVFTDAMPASTVKPVMALGFLQSTDPPDQEKWLIPNIKTSNSRSFLNRLFCGLSPRRSESCQQPAGVLRASRQLGWNDGCERPGESCGNRDLLFGRSLKAVPRGYREEGGQSFNPVTRTVLLGRFMIKAVEQGNQVQFRDFNPRELSLTPSVIQELRACQRNGYAACTGAPLVYAGWGQGESRVTPLGVASMMARLGAAANGLTELRFPHIVRRINLSNGERYRTSVEALGLGDPEPIDVDREYAERILGAMTHTFEKSGTANRPCEAVFGDCSNLHGVAGKTGTVTVDNRYETLRGRRACRRADGRSPSNCVLMPWKWYAGVFKTDPRQDHYDKAFAVLVERNWRSDKSGTLDDRGDTHNAAAEIAFRVIQQVRQNEGERDAKAL